MTSSTSQGSDRKLDRWADWLVRGRDRGATEAQMRQRRRLLARARDRVLREATVRPGELVVDLGAGTGLLALEARRRVKGSGFVVAVDISGDALSECKRQSVPGENIAPLACVVGDAMHLPLLSESIDVVVTRSVLIYLSDKQAGVRELYRVLKSGGRASIFEPINEVGGRIRSRLLARGFYDKLQPEWGEVLEYYEAHKHDWYGTMVGWDERDLIEWFEMAGFSRVKMSYEFASGVQTRKLKKDAIAAYIRSRPNPNTPSYEEVAQEVLRDRAGDYLNRYVEFLLNAGGGISAWASVYLVARR